MRHSVLVHESSLIGSSLGDYRIEAVIGRGASGYVYRARHVPSKREVALKLPRPDRLYSLSIRDELFQEAEFLKLLRHPHILRCYGVGVENGITYLVTKYAPGRSLRHLLNQTPNKPLPLATALPMLSQIGSALTYAHQHGVIHRDIKPDNILLNERGEALLADLSIAVKRTHELDQIADASGTPGYMPIEQSKGIVDERGDIHAFGVTAYEILTGYRPFKVSHTSKRAYMYEPEHPIPPTLLNPNLPPQIDSVLLKALERRRVNRYQDVSTFIEALLAGATAPISGHQTRQDILRAQCEQVKEQYLEQGEQLYLDGEYEAALAAYEQALNLDAHCAYAYCGQGLALYKLEHYPEALAAFQQAIYCDPYDAAFYNNKGFALCALACYPEALTAYEQALNLDPEFVYAQQGKMRVLKRLGYMG